jgi:tetratricopeptide (TPR) repeat protein
MAALAWPAGAAERDQCYRPSSPKAQISACSKKIAAGRTSGRRLAILHNNRGNGYLALKRHREAIADYRRAIDLDPLYATPYYNRGNAYLNQRRHRWAVEDYSVAISLRPKYPDAIGNRGLAFERLGDRTAAIRDFRRAIRLRPGDRVGTAGLKRLKVKR